MDIGSLLVTFGIAGGFMLPVSIILWSLALTAWRRIPPGITRHWA